MPLALDPKAFMNLKSFILTATILATPAYAGKNFKGNPTSPAPSNVIQKPPLFLSDGLALDTWYSPDYLNSRGAYSDHAPVVYPISKHPGGPIKHIGTWNIAQQGKGPYYSPVDGTVSYNHKFQNLEFETDQQYLGRLNRIALAIHHLFSHSEHELDYLALQELPYLYYDENRPSYERQWEADKMRNFLNYFKQRIERYGLTLHANRGQGIVTKKDRRMVSPYVGTAPYLSSIIKDFYTHTHLPQTKTLDEALNKLLDKISFFANKEIGILSLHVPFGLDSNLVSKVVKLVILDLPKKFLRSINLKKIIVIGDFNAPHEQFQSFFEDEFDNDIDKFIHCSEGHTTLENHAYFSEDNQGNPGKANIDLAYILELSTNTQSPKSIRLEPSFSQGYWDGQTNSPLPSPRRWEKVKR